MGRSSEFTEEVAAQILERIAHGESVRKICVDFDMPGQATVYRWLADPVRVEFREQYARAREAQADFYFEECLEIADDGAGDFTVSTSDGGAPKLIFDGEHVQRAKLRVDTRKWMAGKLRPKVYGDRQILDLGDETLKQMSDERLNARLAQLLRKAGVAGDPGGDEPAGGAA